MRKFGGVVVRVGLWYVGCGVVVVWLWCVGGVVCVGLWGVGLRLWYSCGMWGVVYVWCSEVWWYFYNTHSFMHCLSCGNVFEGVVMLYPCA